MTKKRRTAEQIISKLREAEVMLAQSEKMLKVCRKIGVMKECYFQLSIFKPYYLILHTKIKSYRVSF